MNKEHKEKLLQNLLEYFTNRFTDDQLLYILIFIFGFTLEELLENGWEFSEESLEEFKGKNDEN